MAYEYYKGGVNIVERQGFVLVCCLLSGYSTVVLFGEESRYSELHVALVPDLLTG